MFAGGWPRRPPLPESPDLTSLAMVQVLTTVFAHTSATPTAQELVLRLVRCAAMCGGARAGAVAHRPGLRLGWAVSPPPAPPQLSECLIHNPFNYCRAQRTAAVETMLSAYHTLTPGLQAALLDLVDALVHQGHRLGDELRAYCALLEGTAAVRAAEGAVARWGRLTSPAAVVHPWVSSPRRRAVECARHGARAAPLGAADR